MCCERPWGWAAMEYGLGFDGHGGEEGKGKKWKKKKRGEFRVLNLRPLGWDVD